MSKFWALWSLDLPMLITWQIPAGRRHSGIFHVYLRKCLCMPLPSPPPDPPPSPLMVTSPHDAELSDLQLPVCCMLFGPDFACGLSQGLWKLLSSAIFMSLMAWAGPVWLKSLVPRYSDHIFAPQCKRKISCWHQNFKACSEESCDSEPGCKNVASYEQEIKFIFCSTWWENRDIRINITVRHYFFISLTKS